MANRYPKKLFNVLENSPYHADKLRYFWANNPERRESTDVYDVDSETNSKILWEFQP